MNKKILSLMLVLAMVFILAACQPSTPSGSAPAAQTTAPAADAAADAGDEPADTPDEPASDLEPYELVYYLYSTKASDQDKVLEEAINAIIQPKFNATIDFIMIAGGDWNDKAIPPLRAGEKIDIFWTPEWMQYMSNITNGSLLALDDPNGPYGDLINTYAPDTVRDLGDFIAANRVGGFLYGVATNKELCVPGGLMWNLDLVEKYDIDADSVDTIEELDAVLQAFKETDEFKDGMYPLLSVDAWSFLNPFIQGFMGDMDAISMHIGEPNAKDGEPILYYQDPQVKAWMDQKAKWYSEKLVHPDSYLKSFTDIDYLNSGAFLVSTQFVLKGGQVKAKELQGQSGNADLRLYEVQTSASVNVTTHAGGSMLGIPVTSQDPARAMMYINEMHQNEELLNTMAWGVEGVHYDMNSDGMVVPKSMNGWSDSHGGMWTLGNQFKQKLSAGEDPQKYEQMAALTAEAWPHESLGFRFNREGYDNEYAAMYNIKETYHRSLHVGVNVDTDYDKMLSELEAAGITTTFFEDVKAQYAEWKAAK